MDGKGREGSYNFFSNDDDWGQPGAGHRALGAAPPPAKLPSATPLVSPMYMTQLRPC